jgi:F-type H+-transporting ATPase subunit b
MLAVLLAATLMCALAPAAYAAPAEAPAAVAASATVHADTASGAEGAAQEEAGNPLIPNLLEFIPMLIGFLLLLLILGKFGWPVILGMLDKRVTTIKESLESAENAKIEGERLLEEYRAQLADAKKQAAQIIADAKQSGEAIKADLATQAQSEAESIIAKARAATEAEKKAAIAGLQSSVADLSVLVAGRIIGQGLSEADHRKIIEHYLSEAGALDAS